MDDKKISENFLTNSKQRSGYSQAKEICWITIHRCIIWRYSHIEEPPPLRPEPIWFSPASVYVWLLNSQMSGEQKELQQPSSPSTHTCHNHGPTPHSPNNESAWDRKKNERKENKCCKSRFQKRKDNFYITLHIVKVDDETQGGNINMSDDKLLGMDF